MSRLHSYFYNQKLRIVRNLRHAKTTIMLSRGHWPLMAGFVLLAVLNAVTDSFTIMLIAPLLESFSATSVFSGVPLLDRIGQLLQPLDPITRLRVVAGILFAVIVIKGVVQFGADIIVYILPQRIERDLRMRAFDAMMHSQLSFSEGISAGEVGNFTASFPARTGIAARFLIQLLASALTILMILLVMLAITPSALLVLAAFAVMSSLLFKRLTGKLSRELDTQNTAVSQAFSQAYFEAVNNRRVIRVFNATEVFLRRIYSLLTGLRRIQTLTVITQNSTYPFFATLAGVLVCGSVLIASFYQPDQAQAMLGFMLVFLVASLRILAPFSVMHISRMHYAIHADAVSQLASFFDRAFAHRDIDGTIPVEQGKVSIEFDDVSFGYTAERDVIKNISFSIKAGEFVALVGRSGSGKSTLLGLLTRLYRPKTGEIRIGGVPLDEVAIDSWWQQVSFISQEVPIFNASITENITFGSSGPIDVERLDDAIRLSASEGFVARLQHGRDTKLGEFGSILSGGERQRLSLARAFYHRRPVILLDEVTSQLDAETEARITEALQLLRAHGHTIIVIAHRLSTVLMADRIMLIDEGSCVAMGSHAELLASSPQYAGMYSKFMLGGAPGA